MISLVGYLHTCFLNLSLPRKENEEKESSPFMVKPKYFTVISGNEHFLVEAVMRQIQSNAALHSHTQHDC